MATINLPNELTENLKQLAAYEEMGFEDFVQSILRGYVINSAESQLFETNDEFIMVMEGDEASGLAARTYYNIEELMTEIRAETQKFYAKGEDYVKSARTIMGIIEEIYEEDPKLNKMFDSPEQLFDKVSGQIAIHNS